MRGRSARWCTARWRNTSRARCAGKPDPECILALRAEALRRTYPPASDERVAADTARAMALVLTGAKSLAEGSTVAGTEVGFGGAHGDVVVNVGKYALHVNGSIDRIDRLADGSLAIVDYKTGDIGKYRDHPERYVQPLLYTLAAEALLGRARRGAPRVVSEPARRQRAGARHVRRAARTGRRAARSVSRFAVRKRRRPAAQPVPVVVRRRVGDGQRGTARRPPRMRAFCPYRGFCRSQRRDLL